MYNAKRMAWGVPSNRHNGSRHALTLMEVDNFELYVRKYAAPEVFGIFRR